MALGPVELIVIGFPQTRVSGVRSALKELVDSKTIRIIDIMFISKDANGNKTIRELTSLDEETYAAFDSLCGNLEGLLSEEDGRKLADVLEPNSSAAVMLFENTWAADFANAVAAADGRLILAERIPRATIEELMAVPA